MTTTFSEIVRTRATATWAVMVAATVFSWWIGAENGIGNARVAGVVVLAVAFVKVYLVGRNFMEIRDAPLVLQRILTVYVVGTGAALIACVLLGD